MDPLAPTRRLYLDDGSPTEGTALVIAVDAEGVALDRSPFYPGGGGQPADHGTLGFDDGSAVAVRSIDTGADGVSWHRLAPPTARPLAIPIGTRVVARIDTRRREVFSRYHTLLHVMNTIAMREYGGWITGAQIGTEHARIDFKLDGIGPALCERLQAGVDAVIDADRRVHARSITEAEFRDRPELLRTLDVSPPVIGGHVRIVEIDGFDAQACGGTHVGTTGRIGRFAITRTENKGRNNKRLYVKLVD